MKDRNVLAVSARGPIARLRAQGRLCQAASAVRRNFQRGLQVGQVKHGTIQSAPKKQMICDTKTRRKRENAPDVMDG